MFRVCSYSFRGIYVQTSCLDFETALFGPGLVRLDSFSTLLSAAVQASLGSIFTFILKPFLVATVLRFSVEGRLVHTKITFNELQLLLSCVTPRMMTAAATAVIGLHLGEKTMTDILTFRGAFVIAAALGVFVPFVPSGLGIGRRICGRAGDAGVERL